MPLSEKNLVLKSALESEEERKPQARKGAALSEELLSTLIKKGVKGPLKSIWIQDVMSCSSDTGRKMEGGPVPARERGKKERTEERRGRGEAERTRDMPSKKSTSIIE